VRQLAGVELGFGAALLQKALVVELFVFVGEAREQFLGFLAAIVGAASELVSDGKTEHTKSELLVGIDGEDVAADGFGLFGLVEVAVELGFCEGFGDSGFGDGF
jgi:hypothetical protein